MFTVSYSAFDVQYWKHCQYKQIFHDFCIINSYKGNIYYVCVIFIWTRYTRNWWNILAMKSSNFAVDETRRDATRSTRLVTIRVNCPTVAAPTRYSDVVMHSQALAGCTFTRRHWRAAYTVLLHSRLARTWCCNYSLQFRVPPECHGDAPAMPSKRPMYSVHSLCTSISSPRPLDSIRNATTLRRIRVSLFGFLLPLVNRKCGPNSTIQLPQRLGGRVSVYFIYKIK